METEAPIYNQILQEEQIQLHKLTKLVESKGGTVLDVNTDAVSCIFPDNKLPFEIVEEIQLKNQLWDEKQTVYKYKLEDKEDDKKRVKVSKMQNTQHIEQYKLNTYYNWRVTADVDDNDFKSLVDKIIASDQSWTIQGPAGAGKSTLIKGIQDALKSKEIEYISLAPTNLAALIIDGMTLHKFATKIRKYETLKNKTYIC
jgi:DNA replication protein DnaC